MRVYPSTYFVVLLFGLECSIVVVYHGKKLLTSLSCDSICLTLYRTSRAARKDGNEEQTAVFVVRTSVAAARGARFLSLARRGDTTVPTTFSSLVETRYFTEKIAIIDHERDRKTIKH
jgi:hypothetical protein